MNDVAVISCWFGKRFNKPNEKSPIAQFLATIKYIVKSILPPRLYSALQIQSVVPIAPENCGKAIFFTNNKLLEKEIIMKGWEYRFLESDQIDGIDSIQSSLTAKKVKFLQLEEDILEGLFKFDYVLYVDSRAIVDDIEGVKSFCDRAIVIRYSPEHKNKNTVWDEVDEAKVVDRYAKTMPETVAFIEEKIKHEGYTHKNKVMATGVILYKLGDINYREPILALCNEVYNTCIKLKQPECQIIWCILSQRYDHLITKVKAQKILTRSV